MSSRIGSAAAVSLAALLSVGCSTSAQQKQEVDTLKAYVKSLEDENAKLRMYKQKCDSMQEMLDVSNTEAKMLEDLRLALLESLKGVKIDNSGDITFDPKNNKWTLASDLLFDSGNFKLTPKGEEVLKKFAETYKGKAVTLRIVGHTDRDPIAKAQTKQVLQFDHNMELGALRACSVFMTLSKYGLTQSRMFVESRGNNNPVAANDTRAENKKKNRRVEIFLVAETGAPQHR